VVEGPAQLWATVERFNDLLRAGVRPS